MHCIEFLNFFHFYKKESKLIANFHVLKFVTTSSRIYYLGRYCRGKKMLKDCKRCSYYSQVARFKQITIHHYCNFFKTSYSFLRMQGKLKECPLADIEIDNSSYQLTDSDRLLEALMVTKWKVLPRFSIFESPSLHPPWGQYPLFILFYWGIKELVIDLKL